MGLPFDIRDAMGKARGDRRLLLFAFALYGLIVFPKALGHVTFLVETIISLNFIREKRRQTFLRMHTVVVRMDEKPF
ncbi:hypothetical protein Goari_022251 [Gossypium aridum]|uniref:Uncharacterized protein n=1 Tax=Gossypium aridum TaxID=34290 RepID=A0A7J8YNI5_GOSAI|nr:hypothetical protein [Gossypium aridum]